MRNAALFIEAAGVMQSVSFFVEADSMPAYVRRYVPMFEGKRREPGIWDAQEGLFYPRPDYCDIDLASCCRWLNERNDHYPTRIVLTAD